MTETEAAKDLAGRCRQTADVSRRAAQWLDGAKEIVRQQQPSLLREFRRYGLGAAKLAAATLRPMCVGVFGPSQAGKSYLISALARKNERPLLVDFDGAPEGVDFVRHINPEGGAESTGLVTRFSLRGVPAPAGFPVHVRLLSQADIVRILGNSFFSDCDLSDENIPDAAQIAALADELAGKRMPSPAGGMGEGGMGETDIWEIRDYFERQFKGEPIVRALADAGYWDRLAELAPILPTADRGRMFAPLWGGLDLFTTLYAALAQALDLVGNHADAFCPLDALVAASGAGFARRADSVIDVTTLDGLAGGEGETLQVRGGGGQTAAIARPMLAALIAELHITMREQPWDFLDHTDLLDFPGARSRENIQDVRAFLGKKGAIESLFLRGKVAYLFERYNAEQELTAMLLCIPPSNQEVRSLPSMVKDWIDATHGASPELRAGVATALFLVLTKFDAEFEEAAGKAEDSSARWSRRLHSSLIDFFGKSHEWPLEWTPGQPFNNCYWLRNPNFLAKHILDYDANRKEIGIRPSEVERIARSRSEFIANPDVRRHFREPERAWDLAFALNDGGISYLVDAVTPVCNPSIKNEQIAQRLAAQRAAMRERLQRYYIGGDLAEEREQRHAAAVNVIENLIRCAAHQRFGRLIRALQLSDAELNDVFFNLEAHPTDERVRSMSARIDEAALRSSIGFADPAEAKGSLVHDKADDYAAVAIEHWVESIRSLADNLRVCRYFHIEQQAMSDFASELILGADRLDLETRIAARVRPALGSRRRIREAVVEPAFLAADTVGAFVMWLGYQGVAARDRPLRRDESRTRVFEPPPPMDFPILSEQPSHFDRVFYGDWFSAYLAFVDANASSLHGQSIDVAKNAELGAILSALA